VSQNDKRLRRYMRQECRDKPWKSLLEVATAGSRKKYKMEKKKRGESRP